MRDDEFSDARIIQSWHTNAGPWTRAVRQGAIDSRRLVTDQAVVEAVLAQSPTSVLDLGCGEGWLARTLTAQGIQVLGVDAVPALIQQAQEAGDGEFRVMSFEAVARGALSVQVDAVVCNFALLGDHAVANLCQAIPTLLNPGGAFIVQTLHPLLAGGEAPYRDGWRAGSWAGFDASFDDPAPWYFRTLESWVALLRRSGLTLREIREPLHPHTGKPASVIFIADRPPESRDGTGNRLD